MALTSLFKHTSSSWFSQKGYPQGVFWILLVSLISNMNDILMRLTGPTLPGIEIIFFRYFFADDDLIFYYDPKR